ncbi:hypothetical protein GW17_00012602 [Ensete ventricosum]|nr:hypothetical protein GW17_00012602 [Ensete ventricosum]RZS00686.1 hypothetical protein BHM03_00030439 [Ensete ventricosum]
MPRTLRATNATAGLLSTTQSKGRELEERKAVFVKSSMLQLQPDNEPRSSLGIGPGLDDAVGPRREFARRFTKGIGKLAGSTPGDHRKKIG